MGECPAEILIGFYYLLGFLYERRGKFAKAIRAFEISLGIMERVYGTLCELVSESLAFVHTSSLCRDSGDAKGRGLGHPFGLLLCSKLVGLTEHEGKFAAAFRYSKKFQCFWDIFPFPINDLSDPNLPEHIFFSSDPPLALFDCHTKKGLSKDGPTRAWIKRGSFLLQRQVLSLFLPLSQVVFGCRMEPILNE